MFQTGLLSVQCTYGQAKNTRDYATVLYVVDTWTVFKQKDQSRENPLRMATTGTSDRYLSWNNGENNRWATAYTSRKRKTPTSACDNVDRQKIPRNGDNLPMTRPETDSPSSNRLCSMEKRYLETELEG